MQDKRRCNRHAIELPATFKVDENQKHISVGVSLNISATGLCLTSKEYFPMGRELPLKIKLPWDENIVINVKVVWIKEVQVINRLEYTMGVKILDEMKADEAKFVKFCADMMLVNYRDREKKRHQ